MALRKLVMEINYENCDDQLASLFVLISSSVIGEAEQE